MSTAYDGAFRELRNLADEQRAGRLGRTLFRDAEVEICLKLIEQRKSLVLVGPEGAGKSAVLHGLCAALAARKVEVRQLSSTDLVAGTRFLGEWQTKANVIAAGAIAARAPLYFADAWNLGTTGTTSNDHTGAWDVLRPMIEDGRLQILAECTPAQLRHLALLPGALALLPQVPIRPLEPAQAAQVVDERARAAGVELGDEVRGTLLGLSGRFLALRAQPGPALALLGQVIDYQAQKRAAGEPEPLSPALVERVLSVYSGLPRFVVSRSESMPVAELRRWFRERIIGQEAAIDAVVETITLFKAGLHDPDRPIGAFLFVGPTGVGKTEVARALSAFLFGSESRLLRLDMSEYKEWDSYQQLIGNPTRPELPARLCDPVRAQPFQVILLDELEKAHANVFDLMLQLLDEGRLTPPGGEPVSFKNTIVVATSNAGAAAGDPASVGFGDGRGGGDAAGAASVRKALAREFRPEFLNRFSHVVVFHPLDRGQVRTIARHELARILAREGVAARRVTVDVDEAAIDLVIDRGFDPRSGARGLKRDLQRQIVVPLATLLVERALSPGAIVRATPEDGRVRFRVVETEESRAHRRELAPVPSAAGRLGRAEAAARVAALGREVEALGAALDLPFLEVERGRIEELRRQPDFWSDARWSGRALRDLDRITGVLDRVEHLRRFAREVAEGLAAATARSALEVQVRALERLEEAVVAARRELLVLGPATDWDALVEVRPVGAAARRLRDLLVGMYRGWARERGAGVEWLAEPATDDEAAFLAVRGRYAFGYLRGESGLHRLRHDEAILVAAVRVAPWTDALEPAAVTFSDERALKGRTGQYGGRLRSQLRFHGPCEGLLQNDRTVAENRELAAQLGLPWRAAPTPSDAIIRRYDTQPFLVRDALLGTASGRPDVLEGPGLHELLCQRADHLGQPGLANSSTNAPGAP